jgi:hypothetical protein
LIGPALGAYFGYKSGGDETRTTQTTLPPEMMGQWNAYSSLANQLAARPYQNTISPFTQDQYGAMDQIRGQAQGGPEQSAASTAFQNFMRGPAANPYIQGAIQKTQDQVQNRMGTGAFASGSFGNAGVAKATAEGLGNATNDLYNQQFAQMGNMIPQGLAFQQQNLGNSSALLQSGAMQQAQGQKTMDNWWNYPAQQLGFMGQPLGFNMGQTSTTSIPGNPYASALGGGLLGLQMGNALTGQTPPPRTPWGY